MATTVGARELKTRLGAWLRRVQQGGTLIVTERGRPVAEIRPITAQRTDERAELAALVESGLLSRTSESRLARFEPVTCPAAPLSLAVVEGREDRL